LDNEGWSRITAGRVSAYGNIPLPIFDLCNCLPICVVKSPLLTVLREIQTSFGVAKRFIIIIKQP